MRRAALVVALAMVLAVPSAAGLSTDSAEATADCSGAPPCGEINPRIVFEFPDLGDEPINLSAGESKTFQGKVMYWTDTDDEGHAPADPTQDIVMRFSFPQLPQWAEMSVEPKELTVPVSSCAECFKTEAEGTQPTAHFEYAQAINLTVTAQQAPKATTGYDYGKLQLFAKSTESAIYNPGYGIREVRVDPGSGEDLASQSADQANGVPGVGAIASIGLLAAAALVTRRRA